MIIELGKHYCHKIICNSKIIGGITVFDQGQGHFHLDKIYIDPSFHNLGIGTRAMYFIEDRYPSTKWTLDTPLYALRNHHFYEKLGYVRVDEKEADGITLVTYEKHLVNG
jgi:GNAT superfamily N-acetyltransferase